MVRNDQKDWDEQCPITEFALNSSVSATTGYAPFELHSGHIPQLGQCPSTDTQFTGVNQFAQQVLWNLMMAHNGIIEHHVMQAHHANRCRKPSDSFSPGDLVYLLIMNLSLSKGWAKKLLPKFSVPYKIVKYSCLNSHPGPPTRAHSLESPSHVPHEPDTGSCT